MRASRILQSIGDAVIVTDADTCVTDMNSVAEGLTGWHIREAVGKPLADVFKIVNESTGKPVESPADKVKATGRVVGLANHTILLAKDGKHTSIDHRFWRECLSPSTRPKERLVQDWVFG